MSSKKKKSESLSINELDRFVNKSCIDKEYHAKVFEFQEFNALSSKINLKLYDDIRNQIYWLSTTVYRISLVSYLKSVKSNHKHDKNFLVEKNNLIVFHPFSSISSELCKLLINDFLYSTLSSTLCRQIIEQICLIKEIEAEGIEDKAIIEASIESHNKHVGAKSLNIDGLNENNRGILKVFNSKRKFGNLAKKYNYEFMYEFFSGDIHSQSTIEKLLPNGLAKKKTIYNELYLKCVLSLIKDCLNIVDKYVNERYDLSKLDEVDFIEIGDFVKSNTKIRRHLNNSG